jgi:poly(A) polymerase
MKLRELLSIMKSVQERNGTSVPYICGGTPRDKYMKNLDNISDLDITTGDKSIDYLSQQFAEELKNKYNVTRKSMDDGHSTIFIGNLKIDFSSNFNAPNIVPILNKMRIQKPTEMQKEMFSRDFTCNALLLSLDLKNIIDPTHKGFQDIKNKKIKTCLSPEITLTTNRNRVVRSIYLASKLGFDIDQSIIDFVKKNPNSVRIATEKAMSDKLNEAFRKDADRASFFLTKMNLWNYIPITEVMYPHYQKHVKGNLNVPK